MKTVTIYIQLLLFPLISIGQEGMLDTSFGTNGEKTISYTGGIFTQNFIVRIEENIFIAGHQNDKATLFKMNEEGDFDLEFGNNGKLILETANESSVHDMQIIDKEHIALYLKIETNTSKNLKIVKINLQGQQDTSFGEDGVLVSTCNEFCFNNINETLEIDCDNKLIVANNLNSNQLKRYNENGSLDTTFGINGTVEFDHRISAITQQHDGKYIVGGNRYVENGLPELVVERYHTDGTKDFTFAMDGIFIGMPFSSITNSLNENSAFTCVDLEIDADDNIIIIGDYHKQDISGGIITNTRKEFCNRLNKDGELDTLFGTPLDFSFPETFNCISGYIIHQNGDVTLFATVIEYFWGLRKYKANESLVFGFGENLGPADCFSSDNSLIVLRDTSLLNISRNTNQFTLRKFHNSNPSFSNCEEEDSGTTPEILETEFEVSPIPFSNFLNVTLNVAQSGTFKIILYASDGKLVQQLMENQLDIGVHELNFSTSSGLPNGHYFISLQSNDKIITKELIKLD